jgi:hypothetical protein
MRKGHVFLICLFHPLVGILSVGTADAQDTEVRLEFQTEVTPAYEAYLLAKEDSLKARIDAGSRYWKTGSPRLLADRMSLVLVKLGQIHLEADRAYQRMDVVVDDVRQQFDEIEDLVRNDVLDQDTSDIASVLNGLRDLFLGTRYEDLKVRVENVMDELEFGADEAESVWQDFRDAQEIHLDDVEVHTDALRTATDPFSVTFHVLGGDFTRADTFMVDRSNIDDFEILEDAFRTAAEETQDAVNYIKDTLEDGTGDNAATIVGFREALRLVNVSLDTMITALDAQPLSTVGQKIGFIEDLKFRIIDIQDLVIEAEDVLAGKTYELEGTEVRPIALLENLADDPENVLLDFYRSATPEVYTFRGLFPEGLSQGLLEIVGADMVINPWASREQMDVHMQTLELSYRARLATDPFDAEASAGVALARSYFIVSDNQQNVEDTIEMLIDGDIAGIAEQFDVDDFDYRDSLDAIRPYLEAARLDPRSVFTVLINLDEDTTDPFVIDAEDVVLPVPLTGDLLGQMLDISETLIETGTDLAQTIDDLLANGEESFELDLDPNLLDFTDIESPLDFMLALEQSNDQFLWITPTGVDRMLDAGNDIRRELADLSDAVTALSKLVGTIHERDEDLSIDTGPVVDLVHDFDARYREVRADFETPDRITEIQGQKVNLSAWTDAPPDSLLQRLIRYLDDDATTDDTLGGLFPVGLIGEAAASDFTGDGRVGFEDFLQFALAFGSQTGDQDFDPRIDLDGNGIVGFEDFLRFSSAFGSTS